MLRVVRPVLVQTKHAPNLTILQTRQRHMTAKAAVAQRHIAGLKQAVLELLKEVEFALVFVAWLVVLGLGIDHLVDGGVRQAGDAAANGIDRVAPIDRRGMLLCGGGGVLAQGGEAGNWILVNG